MPIINAIISLGKKTAATAARQIENKLKARNRGRIMQLQTLPGNCLLVRVESNIGEEELRVAINAELRRNKTTTAYVKRCERMRERMPKLLIIRKAAEFGRALEYVHEQQEVFNGLRLAARVAVL